MNPLEEFLEDYGSEKQAAMPSFGTLRSGAKDAGNTFGAALAVGAGTALATAAIGGATGAFGAIRDAATKGRDFRQMMDVNADLHDHHQQDPKMFNQLYTSLRKANPAFAKDPVIAGTYMRKMLDSPAHAGGLLAEATGSVPSGYGRFLDDVSKSGREAAGGYLKKQWMPDK